MDVITLALAKKYAKEKILEASLGGEVDLSEYAKKIDLPNKISQLENDTGFITKETSDLQNYLTKEQIQKLLEDSEQNLELDTTLTQNGKAADAKAAGDALDELEEKIPTKPEDIGAQPAGSYLTSAPVTAVNGKTGAVQLSAEDVGARPDTWMPTAQEVRALPDTYTPPDQTAEQVGADPKGTAATAVSGHNTSIDAHGDIRQELAAINARLTAFFDSDNQTLDELSEIVAYITSNKSLIDAITTSKVSVGDIINNLATNVSNKPLSAAQGVAIKALIDGVSASLTNYQPKGDYALASDVPTKVSQLTNDRGYLTEHQDISGKLDADKLPQAVEDALAQAKASGDFDGEDGYTPVKGKDYKDGADGVSPTVAVSAITGGHRISITDKNGTKPVDVMDGKDGQDGSSGADGNGIKSAVLNADYTLTLTFDDGTTYTTPSIRGATGATGSAGKDGPAGAAGKDGTDGVGVASIKQTTTSTADGGNNVFTVTLTNGTSASFTVKNGSKGSTGGTGPKGADGKTPVKGTDYYTEADKAEMVAAVISALPDASEVSY